MYRAVRCAVSVTAIAAVFGLTRCFDAAAQTPAPKVAAQLNITAPGREQSNSAEILTRGARLYAMSCQPCHGDRQGNGSVGRADPNNENGHTWHHPDAQLREWILHGKPGPGLSTMPGFNYLGQDDVEAILALIKTWWTAEQRETQADISRRYDQAINKKNKDR